MAGGFVSGWWGVVDALARLSYSGCVSYGPVASSDPRIMVNVRVRKSALRKIDADAELRGMTRSEWLREAIAVGLTAARGRGTTP